MVQTKKDLTERIVELAKENWQNTSEPLLLSRLGSILKAEGFEYKETLDGQGLRNFIDNDVAELTIAQHPQQYAKVSVHPTEVSFSYSSAPVENKSEPSGLDKLRKNRRAFYGFIQAISELPPEEIEGVNIPARVIVRLLEGK